MRRHSSSERRFSKTYSRMVQIFPARLNEPGASVDFRHLTRDPLAEIRYEVQYSASHVCWQPRFAQWNAADYTRLSSVAQALWQARELDQ